MPALLKIDGQKLSAEFILDNQLYMPASRNTGPYKACEIPAMALLLFPFGKPLTSSANSSMLDERFSVLSY
jgi:hypothetical protein